MGKKSKSIHTEGQFPYLCQFYVILNHFKFSKDEKRTEYKKVA